MTALVVVTLVQVGVGAAVAVDTMGTVVGTTAVVAQVEEMEATMLTPTPLAILLCMDPRFASTLTPRALPSGADHPEALVC
jgi:mannose/fructose/N-acetylgalactosamine-specific phosphotransferase system component IIC